MVKIMASEIVQWTHHCLMSACSTTELHLTPKYQHWTYFSNNQPPFPPPPPVTSLWNPQPTELHFALHLFYNKLKPYPLLTLRSLRAYFITPKSFKNNKHNKTEKSRARDKSNSRLPSCTTFYESIWLA